LSKAVKLARLLHVLHAGEVAAARAAATQSRLAPLPWMARALQTQARHETQHATLARAALALCGAGSDAGVADVTVALDARLQCDLGAGRLADSLLGLQGVVEHLGEALLDTLGRHSHTAHTASAPLHALRLRVLAQERGHVLLGARCLAALPHLARQREVLDDYRRLGHQAALATANLLDDARIDGDAFWRTVDAGLTAWHTSDHGGR
jgi:hypothetical protein